MHFQKFEHYGLLLMGELATGEFSHPCSLAQISSHHGVSVPFFKKIVRKLRTAGLVRSKEGVGGGYMLARNPSSITMWEIIAALGDGAAGPDRTATACPVNASCLPQHIRGRLSERIRTLLSTISLKEVAQ
ncbi:Rrf2 family transcriptional regulator [Candidatus Gottesmanbacteria bacterium]|nr:Rrf2 family transcriptional regulator [Candidatus Gottesmanbacteria bacterium]